MSIVIVTKNQYLLASKIHHIILNEGYEYVDVRNSAGRMIGVRENTYTINIIYTPEMTNSQNNREERHDCNVTMRGKVHAYQVYKDLIQQIREQMPDALFLNKCLENLLSDEDFLKIANSEQEDNRKSIEVMSDRRTKKVRKLRKAKRNNKKVLRRPGKRR